MSSERESSLLAPPLREAWIQRWNQNLEGAMVSLAEFEAATEWSELSPESMASSVDQPNRMECLLLKASLLRAQGRADLSAQAISKVDSAWCELAKPRPFRLAFEQGATCLVSGDYAGALDHYLIAQALARDPVEKVFALTNVLFCLEALGLPRAAIEDECAERIAAILRQGDEEEISHARQQFESYLMRKQLYAGQITRSLEAGRQTLGQASYLSSWIGSLPYTTSHVETEPSAQPFGTGYLWQGGFRSRTLYGAPSPTQDSSARTGDRIDRLYLWTWQWMCGLARISAERLRAALTPLLDAPLLANESVENRLLLRNALAWLSLLEPRLESRLSRPIAQVSSTSDAGYPLLQFEFAVIDAISRATQRSAEPPAHSAEKHGLIESLALLENHPLWDSREVHLGALLRAVLDSTTDSTTDSAPSTSAPPVPAPLRAAVTRLRARIEPGSSLRNPKIVVDPALGTVTTYPEAKRTASQPLALALVAIHGRDSLSVSEFAFQAFSIRRYDAFVHSRRVYNLIARMKAILGGTIRLSIRGEVLHIEGQTPPIEIRKADALSWILSPSMSESGRSPGAVAVEARDGETLVSGAKPSPGFSTPARRPKPSVLSDITRETGRFTREDVERVLGVSRASACRVIDSWLKNREVTRFGHARATVYLIQRPRLADSEGTS